MKKPGDSSEFPGIFILYGIGMQRVKQIDNRIGSSYNEEK